MQKNMEALIRETYTQIEALVKENQSKYAAIRANNDKLDTLLQDDREKYKRNGILMTQMLQANERMWNVIDKMSTLQKEKETPLETRIETQSQRKMVEELSKPTQATNTDTLINKQQ